MTFKDDPTASTRKQDHIDLAFASQVNDLDNRFSYEPMLAAHPPKIWGSFSFLNKTMKVPIWVSSMTGGTEKARTINHNLARACKDFGMGMGLGSCRQLLFSDEYLKDFDIRGIMGDDLPLFANLGVAQIEELFKANKVDLIKNLLYKLKADGLIIHVNPFQEWLQPEGDVFDLSPLVTIKKLLDIADYPIVVKEVGQGFGYESMKALMQLPLAAIDFAASGGTNFSMIELFRSNNLEQEILRPLAHVGHSAEEMVNIANQVIDELGDKVLCKEIIISGGVKTFLDGYYLMNSLNMPSVYGQASGFLRHALGGYDALYQYTATQVKGLLLAKNYLRVKK